MLFRSVYFILRRMLRGYLGYVYMIVVPLAIITINGLAVDGYYTDELGRSGMDMIAVGIIIGFQLVGGFFTMETIRSDCLTELKWRLYSLPYSVSVHAFSILISSTLFVALNGLVMVLFTHWVFGVEWGNIGWVVLVLIAVSLFTQLVFMLAVLGIRRYKVAELVGYAYVFGSMIMAGYFFVTAPDTAFVRFFNQYINPLALGETAIIGMMYEEQSGNVWLSIGLLLGGSALLMVLVTLLGRRRLA